MDRLPKGLTRGEDGVVRCFWAGSDPKRTTRSASKPEKAARKLSRFLRIVSQRRPDWKPSRQIFSKSRRSSATGKPHSSSW